MAGRGRGRGGSRGLTFSVETFGFGRGEALPTATAQPPETFPVTNVLFGLYTCASKWLVALFCLFVGVRVRVCVVLIRVVINDFRLCQIITVTELQFEFGTTRIKVCILY